MHFTVASLLCSTHIIHIVYFWPVLCCVLCNTEQIVYSRPVWQLSAPLCGFNHSDDPPQLPSIMLSYNLLHFLCKFPFKWMPLKCHVSTQFVQQESTPCCKKFCIRYGRTNQGGNEGYDQNYQHEHHHPHDVQKSSTRTLSPSWCPTCIGLMPHDALQVDGSSRLAGSQPWINIFRKIRKYIYIKKIENRYKKKE